LLIATLRPCGQAFILGVYQREGVFFFLGEGLGLDQSKRFIAKRKIEYLD